MCHKAVKEMTKEMTAIQQSVKEQNKRLATMSIMTSADAKKLCCIMSIDDVMDIALVSQKAHYGEIPISEFQKLEKELVVKYQFKYHKNPNLINY